MVFNEHKIPVIPRKIVLEQYSMQSSMMFNTVFLVPCQPSTVSTFRAIHHKEWVHSNLSSFAAFNLCFLAVQDLAILVEESPAVNGFPPVTKYVQFTITFGQFSNKLTVKMVLKWPVGAIYWSSWRKLYSAIGSEDKRKRETSWRGDDAGKRRGRDGNFAFSSFTDVYVCRCNPYSNENQDNLPGLCIANDSFAIRR